MTKSELIEHLIDRHPELSVKDVELAVKAMLDHMTEALSNGDRIEIRGFGSFSLHYRAPRIGRNPKTGDSVTLSAKYVPFGGRIVRWLKMFILLLLSVVILMVGIMFAIHNTDKVAIDLVFVQLPQASLSLWLIAAFVIGGICGFLLSTIAVVALKTQLMSSRRKIQTTSKELDQLRTAALKDAV